jgi:hypothetical protein
MLHDGMMHRNDEGFHVVVFHRSLNPLAIQSPPKLPDHQTIFKCFSGSEGHDDGRATAD